MTKLTFILICFLLLSGCDFFERYNNDEVQTIYYRMICVHGKIYTRGESEGWYPLIDANGTQEQCKKGRIVEE